MATSTEQRRMTKFLRELDAGDYDDALHDVHDAIRERDRVKRAAAALMAHQRLSKGMEVRVKLDAELGPKYLLGWHFGPIIQINQTTAKVKVDHPIRRYMGPTIRIPLDALEEVK